jgi:hypothetical protein
MTGKETGTVLTPGMTNQKNPGAVPKITMMSPEGEKLAAVSAPCDAFEIYKSSTAAVKE